MTLKNAAHIKLEADGHWLVQTIEEHCGGTAALARSMAEAFGAGGWGELCGRWHDIGKYSTLFQQHIAAASGYDTSQHDPGRTDHATAGAQLALERLKGMSLPIAYCICGHHSGLMDYIGNGRGNLSFHLSTQMRHCLDDVRAFVDADKSIPNLPKPVFDSDTHSPKAWHLWIRMLFSCLVDADWLDTERFMCPENFAARQSPATLAQLKPILDAYLTDLTRQASATKVNRLRAEVQEACRAAGDWPQGIYSLTVPTGGGKTLSSLLWAMEHAICHDLKHVIIAIPYTSIVVQTADKLRQVFGADNVVEHHSCSDFDKMPAGRRHRLKLATENWDAPIVVTTNVQLFESLYSNKTSRCRKLHNIARSVIILDEVQTLPVENLRPIVDVLDGLNRYMGASILFTTATQPALSGEIGTGLAKFSGLQSNEIIPDVNGLFADMRRVEVRVEEKPRTFESLAAELSEHSQALCVVNTRNEALQLYNALPDKRNAFHLSRMMCQQHIGDKIETIRRCLKNGQPAQVVSTQLIEAGVDIDFPEVWREMAGFDSIAQAAGRCNREGKLELGHVHIFQLEGARLRGTMAKAASTTRDLLDAGAADFLSPTAAREYFRLFYAKLNDTDKANIADSLYKPCPDFERAAISFQMIDDGNSLTIYVPYLSEGEKLTKQLAGGNSSAQLLRRLQRYSVGVPASRRDDVEQMGALKLGDDVYVLPDCSNYNDDTGLVLSNSFLDRELII